MQIRTIFLAAFFFVIDSCCFYATAQTTAKPTDTAFSTKYKKFLNDNTYDYFDKSFKKTKNDTTFNNAEWNKLVDQFIADLPQVDTGKSNLPKTSNKIIVITPQMKESTCLAGNCINGYGTWLIMNTANTKLFYVGAFKDSQRNGQGAIYWMQPDANDHSVLPRQLQHSMAYGQYKNNALVNGTSVILNNYDNNDTIQKITGTYEDAELKEGAKYFYTYGSKKGMYIKYEGTYVGKDLPKGTITFHGYQTQPEISYLVENFVDGKNCISGDCEQGDGLMINNRAIYKGKFKKGHLKKGTVEFFNAAESWRNGLYVIPGDWHTIKAEGTYKKYAISETGPATFTPVGTNDVIKGEIYSGDPINGTSESWKHFSFTPDVYTYFKYRYAGNVEPFTDAPEWIKHVYSPVLAASLAQAEADKSEYIRSEMARKQAAYGDPFYYPGKKSGSTSYSANSNSGKTITTTTSKHNCITCGGSGWADQADAYGHYTRSQCRRCNGLGYTEN